MKLKLIDRGGYPHGGYGAGSGEIITEEYECPCGKGVVKYEKDDTPGFREKSVDCYCKDCDEKYDFSRGIAKEKNN